MDEKPRGMDARSLDYVLGVEDCAMIVYEFLEEGNDLQQLKEAMGNLLDDAKVIRTHRFMHENGLTS